MQAAHYLNNVICACSDEAFGQDAVEYAIVMGHVHLSGQFQTDVAKIMSQYDQLCSNYRAEVARNEAVLAASHEPLLAQIRKVA